MQSLNSPSAERRRSQRRRACFPVEVHHHEGAPATALVREVSCHGVQLLTREPIGVKTRVAMMMYIEDASTSHPSTGTVVRVTAPEDRGGFWGWVVTVDFDDPISALEPRVVEVAERQRNLGV